MQTARSHRTIREAAKIVLRLKVVGRFLLKFARRLLLAGGKQVHSAASHQRFAPRLLLAGGNFLLAAARF